MLLREFSCGLTGVLLCTASAKPFAFVAAMEGNSFDVIVALSDDDGLAPVTFRGRALPKVVVAIPSDRTSPPTLPHRVRQDVAHELGQVIGLGHNDDEAALMCGGIWCHFALPREGFLPLTKGEETKLLEMYPPNWQAELSKR